MNPVYHTPVMLKECLEALQIRPSSKIADVTCGEGGHSLQIAALNPQGVLHCLDRDSVILGRAKERLSAYSHVRFHEGTFDTLPGFLNGEKVDGILADLGISMFHLKAGQEEKSVALGISYTDHAPLDMRLSRGEGVSAADVVNRFPEEKLANLIYEYGEESFSRRIAREIVRNRPVASAEKLAEIVSRVKHSKPGSRSHPATQTFQAIRIYVNRELEILENFLKVTPQLLNPGGRLVILTYHSLEDRTVKFGFKALEKEGFGSIITKKPVDPSEEEIRNNRAARSAKMRVFEKG